ncbi:MAG: hypothetical protein IH849_15140 [Acidobacteria bacterium]|nr:hypothetical protein [Acidobacteriota bacterium]
MLKTKKAPSAQKKAARVLAAIGLPTKVLRFSSSGAPPVVVPAEAFPTPFVALPSTDARRLPSLGRDVHPNQIHLSGYRKTVNDFFALSLRSAL